MRGIFPQTNLETYPNTERNPMIEPRINQQISVYTKRFHTPPTFIASAPGRINLIGEHTDYTEGFVLPVAIDREVTIVFSPRQDDLIQIFSMDFDEIYEANITELEKGQNHWFDYINGIAWALIDAGFHLSGWQGVISGNIPIGAGLSSSAAFEIAVGKTFSSSSEITINPTRLALLAQNAEKHWVGVNVGIMDQLISSAGKANHAMLLDCRTLSFDFIPIPEQISLVVLDTLTRRELTHSAYNTRHEEVKQATKILDVPSLRDASIELLSENSSSMPKTLYKRARHIVTENERVSQFVNAMRKNEIVEMGALINASHASLRDDFEVSSEALDTIADLAQNHPGCLGARMLGAGFGGCALALLYKGHQVSFIQSVSTAYRQKTGIEPNIFQVRSTDGARVDPLAFVLI
jgi:galactokinase